MQTRDLDDIIRIVKAEQEKLMQVHRRELMKINYFGKLKSEIKTENQSPLKSDKDLN